MMNKSIHKLGYENGNFVFTKCGIPLHIKGGLAHEKWDKVDCKKCLAKKSLGAKNE